MNKIRTTSELLGPFKFWINTFNSILLQFHNKDNVQSEFLYGMFFMHFGFHMTLHMFAEDICIVFHVLQEAENAYFNFWGL